MRLLDSIKISLFIISICLGQGGIITTDGTTPYSLSSPYAADDLFELQYCQSADEMYLVHNDYSPRKLYRSDHANWTLETITFEHGPFMAQNTDEDITITPSATTGTITLTASEALFYPEHVGSLWQIIEIPEAETVEGTVWTAGDSNSAELLIQVDREYALILSGPTFIGTAILQRSYDSGVTWLEVESWPDRGNYEYRGKEKVADALYRVYIDDMELSSHMIRKDEGWITYNLTAKPFDQKGEVLITSYDSNTQLTGTVIETMGGTTATSRWSEGAWSEHNGYPCSVTLYDERLVFGGTYSEPQTVWLSYTNDWDNFKVDDTASSSLKYTISSDQVNVIRWLSPHDGLMIGTSGAEFRLSSSSPGEPLSNENFSVRRQSNYGSELIQPVVIDNYTIFCQRNAEKIRQLRYDLSNDSWISPELTVIAEHITDSGIKEMAYQRVPYQILYCVLNNGDLIGLALEDTQQVQGWFVYTFDGDCESVAVISGDTEDTVWVVVNRTIDGNDVRYIEEFMPYVVSNQEDGYYVDCGLSYDGGDAVTISTISLADPMVVVAPGHAFVDGDKIRFNVSGMSEIDDKVYTVSTVTGGAFEVNDVSDAVDINSVDFTAFTSGTVQEVAKSFSGLDHLEGESVVASGDGGYAGSYTVSSGAVTLNEYYNTVHIGLSFTAKAMPMNLEFLTTGGQLQGRRKRITAVTARLNNSLDVKIGPTWDSYESLVFRQASDSLNEATPWFTGDKRLLFQGDYSRSGDIAIQSDLPLPLNLLSLIVEYEVTN